VRSPGIAKRTRSKDRQSEEKEIIVKKTKFLEENPKVGLLSISYFYCYLD